MKSWIVAIVIAIVVGICTTINWQYNRIKSLEEDLNTSILNEKALLSETDSLKGESKILYLTINQLASMNDSISNRMKDISKDLKIKEKQIQELQYKLSESSKVDTITFKDTVFRDNFERLDTLIQDDWYKINLSLIYPSTIKVEPSFKNESVTTVYAKKETVKPEKKCWFTRLFQKKHIVVTVTTVENNPYTTIKENRYIKIIE